MELDARHHIVNTTIEEFVTGLPAERPAISGKLRETIDSCFSEERKSIQDIMGALKSVEEQGDPELKTWAAKIADTIYQRSPTSVLVTLQQMRIGRQWNIAEAFQHEYNIATKFMAHHDFVEGVTARLVRREKARPNWQPNTFEEVSAKNVAQFFRDPPNLPLLNFTEAAQYKDYPHAWISLPREQEVEKVIRQGKYKTPEEIIEHFVEVREGKQGVRQKVAEILERKVK
jgi:3-hydroxyisobutyryl-CoA hydrolase